VLTGAILTYLGYRARSEHRVEVSATPGGASVHLLCAF
jgi:hypothetical protein